MGHLDCQKVSRLELEKSWGTGSQGDARWRSLRGGGDLFVRKYGDVRQKKRGFIRFKPCLTSPFHPFHQDLEGDVSPGM